MSFQFSVQSSEHLLDAPIISVRRDRVTMPNGEANREIVEHFGAIAVVCEKDGNIVLEKQYRHSVGRHLWELPAGLLDKPDEPALECAKRELKEEVGLEAQSWSLITDLVTSPGFCDEAVRVFHATDVSKTERPEAEDEEADLTWEWVPLEKARHMVLAGDICNSIAIAGIMCCGGQERSIDTAFDLRPSALANRKRELKVGDWH
ncbi:MAG: NUDIX hydrolase [Corynebacterium glucuronolyticum]|nr:NUDIX hydrolase [Corynebacterium glucuronolyticum]MDD7586142.1 NUDIX hydrolase [Mycobacteriaceae bacterium]MDY5833746.1 NUDIX hydrolase [Corynebacterium glucuronolyticum]